MKNDKTGLGNPAAVALVSKAAIPVAEKAIKKGGNFVSNNTKPIFFTLATIAALYYGPKAYKKWRAKRYANDNIGNPNLTAATIIHESFTRFEVPGFLGYLLPTIDISTNEDALNEIASRPGINIKEVAKAYKILFDRTLATDVQNGLSTSELNTWYKTLQAKGFNDTETLYPIGSKLYVARREGILINEAERIGGKWEGTNRLYKNAGFAEEIGEVIANGKHNHENYYIVEDCSFFSIGCNTGVVLQNQVTNEKI